MTANTACFSPKCAPFFLNLSLNLCVQTIDSTEFEMKKLPESSLVCMFFFIKMNEAIYLTGSDKLMVRIDLNV